MDPYKVLGVGKDFTMEELRRNYKRQVIKYHPDRKADISSTPVFQTLTFAYNYLVNEFKERQQDKEHHELKSAAMATPAAAPNVNLEAISGKRFNAKVFNEFFEKNRINDVMDDGYGDWVEDVVEKKDGNAIVNYKEPEPMNGSSRFGNVYELGVEKITDYSGDNRSNRNLGYMDYRLAHTTSRLVDPSHVEERQEFKTVDELKKHRAKVTFVMSPEDVRRQQIEKDRILKQEQARLETLKKKDGIIGEIYNKTHKFMLQALGSGSGR